MLRICASLSDFLYLVLIRLLTCLSECILIYILWMCHCESNQWELIKHTICCREHMSVSVIEINQWLWLFSLFMIIWWLFLRDLGVYRFFNSNYVCEFIFLFPWKCLGLLHLVLVRERSQLAPLEWLTMVGRERGEDAFALISSLIAEIRSPAVVVGVHVPFCIKINSASHHQRSSL